MKKLTVLLAALAVCLCVAGCVDPGKQTDPTQANNETSAPAVSTAEGAQPGQTEATLPAVDPTQPSDIPDMTDESALGTIAVPGPDEIPQPPEADYTLPPDERPGDRVTDVPKS